MLFTHDLSLQTVITSQNPLWFPKECFFVGKQNKLPSVFSCSSVCLRSSSALHWSSSALHCMSSMHSCSVLFLCVEATRRERRGALASVTGGNIGAGAIPPSSLSLRAAASSLISSSRSFKKSYASRSFHVPIHTCILKWQETAGPFGGFWSSLAKTVSLSQDWPLILGCSIFSSCFSGCWSCSRTSSHSDPSRSPASHCATRQKFKATNDNNTSSYVESLYWLSKICKSIRTLIQIIRLPEVILHAADDLHHFSTHLLSNLDLQFFFLLPLT